MKFFKNESDEVFAYEHDGSQDEFIRDGLTPITLDELAILQAPTPEKVAEQAKSQALQDYNQAVEAIIGQVPNTELSSWTKQETEARNLTGPTPMIDQLIISRNQGETREVLAVKIIANADAYAVGYAQVLGEYQAKLKAIG